MATRLISSSSSTPTNEQQHRTITEIIPTGQTAIEIAESKETNLKVILGVILLCITLCFIIAAAAKPETAAMCTTDITAIVMIIVTATTSVVFGEVIDTVDPTVIANNARPVDKQIDTTVGKRVMHISFVVVLICTLIGIFTITYSTNTNTNASATSMVCGGIILLSVLFSMCYTFISVISSYHEYDYAAIRDKIYPESQAIGSWLSECRTNWTVPPHNNIGDVLPLDTATTTTSRNSTGTVEIIYYNPARVTDTNIAYIQATCADHTGVVIQCSPTTTNMTEITGNTDLEYHDYYNWAILSTYDAARYRREQTFKLNTPQNATKTHLTPHTYPFVHTSVIVKYVPDTSLSKIRTRVHQVPILQYFMTNASDIQAIFADATTRAISVLYFRLGGHSSNIHEKGIYPAIWKCATSFGISAKILYIPSSDSPDKECCEEISSGTHNAFIAYHKVAIARRECIADINNLPRANITVIGEKVMSAEDYNLYNSKKDTINSIIQTIVKELQTKMTGIFSSTMANSQLPTTTYNIPPVDPKVSAKLLSSQTLNIHISATCNKIHTDINNYMRSVIDLFESNLNTIKNDMVLKNCRLIRSFYPHYVSTNIQLNTALRNFISNDSIDADILTDLTDPTRTHTNYELRDANKIDVFDVIDYILRDDDTPPIILLLIAKSIIPNVNDNDTMLTCCELYIKLITRPDVIIEEINNAGDLTASINEDISAFKTLTPAAAASAASAAAALKQALPVAAATAAAAAATAAAATALTTALARALEQDAAISLALESSPEAALVTITKISSAITSISPATVSATVSTALSTAVTAAAADNMFGNMVYNIDTVMNTDPITDGNTLKNAIKYARRVLQFVLKYRSIEITKSVIKDNIGSHIAIIIHDIIHKKYNNSNITDTFNAIDIKTSMETSGTAFLTIFNSIQNTEHYTTKWGQYQLKFPQTQVRIFQLYEGLYMTKKTPVYIKKYANELDDQFKNAKKKIVDAITVKFNEIQYDVTTLTNRIHDEAKDSIESISNLFTQ